MRAFGTHSGTARPAATTFRSTSPSTTRRALTAGLQAAALATLVGLVTEAPAAAQLRAGSASSLSVAAATAAATTAPTPVRTWSPEHTLGMKTTKTSAQAVAEAKAFDVITAHSRTYSAWAAQMKTANPALQLLVYTNGVFTYRTNLPESYYSHNASGQRIRARDYPTTFLMSPTSTGWRTWAAQQAATLVEQSGYHGVYIDVLGPASLSTSYVTSVPVNPATGTTWSRKAWLQATAGVAATVKARMGTRPVLANGLSSGNEYYDPVAPTSSLTASNADHIGGEAWLRSSFGSLATFRSETDWLKDIRMVTDVQNRGMGAMVLTKAWASGTLAAKQRWHQYALASFLLATNGSSLFEFQYTERDASTHYTWNDAAVGTATSSYAKVGGVYTRNFTRGKVLVNPGSTTVTVRLGASYRTLTGATVTSVTLPPDTGSVLRKV